MGDEVGEKLEKNCSLQETDSFEEPKGVPISLEPVFSTAGKNIRIDVKQESIVKSKNILNNDLKATSSANSFNSPLNRAKSSGNRAFVSPFRRDAPSTSFPSNKRPVTDETGDFGAPPPKKTAVSPDEPPERHEKEKHNISHKKEMKEFHADVLRVSPIYEKDQFRMILQKSSSSPLILATCSYRRGRDIKFGDKVHVDCEVLKKDDSNMITEVYIEKVIKNTHDGARPGIKRHLINQKPFCTPPKFIHELSDEKIKRTVIQVNIVDLNMEVYQGCSMCKRFVSSASSKKSDSDYCSKCKSSKAKASLYSRMRVMDFSGQILVNVCTKTMEKLLELFGYEGIAQWIEFKDPQEKKAYVFRPIMIEIEKNGKEWECVDVSSVNWAEYGDYLKEKERNIKSLRSTDQKQ